MLKSVETTDRVQTDHRTGRVLLAATAYLGLSLFAWTFSGPNPLVILFLLGTSGGLAYHLLMFVNDRFELHQGRIRRFDCLNRLRFDADLAQIRVVDSPEWITLQSPQCATRLDKPMRNYGRFRWELEGHASSRDLHFPEPLILRWHKPLGTILGVILLIFFAVMMGLLFTLQTAQKPIPHHGEFFISFYP